MSYTDHDLGPENLDLSLPHLRAEKKTVLLVDDDATLLRGLQRTLADQGYELHTAICAAEARVVLARHTVDLIVSDNLMSGQLGTDFLAGVRVEYPNIPLVMLSGYMPAAAAQRAMDQGGVSQVLTKPCKAVDLITAIRDALR